jgi:hypothetical protein
MLRSQHPVPFDFSALDASSAEAQQELERIRLLAGGGRVNKPCPAAADPRAWASWPGLQARGRDLARQVRVARRQLSRLRAVLAWSRAWYRAVRASDRAVDGLKRLGRDLWARVGRRPGGE